MNLLLSHPLYTAFSKVRPEDKYSDEDIEVLKGIVSNCAKEAETILSHISETFKQYTLHDLSHSINVANRINDILPRDENGNIPLTALELTILWCSILLHDSGMAVTDEEKKIIFSSKDYDIFLSVYRDELKQQNKDTYSKYNSELSMFAEYVRRKHEVRSKNLIESQFADLLKYNNQSFASIVGRICESHCWGVRYSQDITNPDKAVFNLEMERKFPGHSINERYLACCLRLGDILDFDYTRTPELAMNYIDFTQEKSLQEWQKHLGVQKFESDKHRINIHAECSSTQQYVDVNSFTDWIDKEIQDCTDLLEDNNPKHISEKGYIFKLSPVVKRKIGMVDSNYVAGNFKFQLEYDEIMKLLMDKALYPDPSLFLRELLQNALDACRMQDALVKQHNKDDDDVFTYTPHIAVFDHSEETENPRIVFQDNGIGMSEEIVRNYFLRVGKSYYRSNDFKTKQYKLKTDYNIQLDACSNFGIGFLSCFLVGDRIKVETYKDGFGNVPLEIEIDGANKYFTIKKVEKKKEKANRFYNGTKLELDGPPNYSGTRITVFIDKKKWNPLVSLKEKAKNKEDDDDADDDEIIEKKPNDLDLTKGIAAFTLKTYAVNVDYQITIHKINKDKNEIIETKIEAWGWEPELPPLPVGLDEFWRKYLVPVRIPFEEYEETKGIRGGAWFWFLNDGNGKPIFKKGFLKIDEIFWTTISVDVVSIELACRIKDKLKSKKKINEFLKTIEFHSSSVLRAFLQNIFKDEKENDTIPLLNQEEKNILIKILKDNYSFKDGFLPPKYLITSEKLLNALYNSDIESMFKETIDHNIITSSSFETDSKISLYGILAPAGISTFNPSTGQTEKEHNFLHSTITARVDLRSGNAIIPGANRLSLLVKDSQELLEYIHYPLVITVERIIYNNKSELWYSWFRIGWSRILSGKYFSKGLLIAWSKGDCLSFYKDLTFTIHYQDNSEEKLKTNELILKHGEWVLSIAHKGTDYYKDKFGITTCTFDYLLECLPNRKINGKNEIHVGKLLEYFKEKK